MGAVDCWVEMAAGASGRARWRKLSPSPMMAVCVWEGEERGRGAAEGGVSSSSGGWFAIKSWRRIEDVLI